MNAKTQTGKKRITKTLISDGNGIRLGKRPSSVNTSALFVFHPCRRKVLPRADRNCMQIAAKPSRNVAKVARKRRRTT